MRSTTELQQLEPQATPTPRRGQGRAIAARGANVKRGLELWLPAMQIAAMPDPNPTTRAERLARQLRANLHRRKAQARALDAMPEDSAAGEQPALSKSLPDR